VKVSWSRSEDDIPTRCMSQKYQRVSDKILATPHGASEGTRTERDGELPHGSTMLSRKVE
jgi:hypothetical protein